MGLFNVDPLKYMYCLTQFIATLMIKYLSSKSLYLCQIQIHHLIEIFLKLNVSASYISTFNDVTIMSNAVWMMLTKFANPMYIYGLSCLSLH